MVRKRTTRTLGRHASRARNVLHGLETRDAILQAAARLFSTRDYDSVTMREIARHAACSHTAIYLHFKDKECLLEAIVFPELEELRGALLGITESADLGDEEKLVRVGHAVVDFSLARRSRHRVLFATRAARVDMPQEKGNLNHTRIGIFDLMRGLCGKLLGFSTDDPRALAAGGFTSSCSTASFPPTIRTPKQRKRSCSVLVQPSTWR